MNIALWIVQSLLAALFLMAGGMKVVTPIPELVANGMAFAADAPWAARLSGAAEVLGALGLILPSLTRIKPALTPIAAACLALVMALAAGLHLVRGEIGGIAAPFVLLILCLFVAWGRSKKSPIEPRVSGSAALEAAGTK